MDLYWDEFARWLVARQLAPGGDLTNEENDKWLERMDTLWCEFTSDERKESNERFHKYYPPHGSGYIDCPLDSPIHKVKMRPLKRKYEQPRQSSEGGTKEN